MRKDSIFGIYGDRLPSNGPPAKMLDVVMFHRGLQMFVLCHEVVCPPEPGGDVVGDDDVNGVVAAAQQEEGDTQHGEEQRDGVQGSAGAV